MHWSQFINNVIFVLHLTLLVTAQRKRFIKKGDDVTFQCSRKNAKLIRISDDKGYIYLLIKNGEPQPIQGDWVIEKYESKSDSLDLTLRLPDFDNEKETTVRCEDERENGFEIALRAIIPPKIEISNVSGSSLAPPDQTFVAKCTAIGGNPMPSIQWTDSLGNIYDVNSPKVSQTNQNTRMESTLRLGVNRDFDGELISCEVRHVGNLTVKALPRLSIDYAPTSAEINFSARYFGDALGANCSANGRPRPELAYFLSDGTVEREVDSMYILTENDTDKFIKCRATNRHGSRDSTMLRMIIQLSTQMPITQRIVTNGPAVATTQSVNLDPNLIPSTQKSESGAIMNSSLTADAPSDSDYISAANNITISCVAVGVLCTAVIIGIMVRRKLRYKAETYRTDVTVYDEGTAFQDPELEAKFKKEYFM